MRGTNFDTHLAPTLPTALLSYLDNYSLQLYGAPGVRLQDTEFMLLWADMLPDAIIRQLSPRCSAPPTLDGDVGVPFLYWPFNFRACPHAPHAPIQRTIPHTSGEQRTRFCYRARLNAPP